MRVGDTSSRYQLGLVSLFFLTLSISGQVCVGEPSRISISDDTVAEVVVYDHFFRQLQLSGNENRTRFEDGNRLHPNMNFNVSPTLQNSENQVNFNIDVSVNGTAWTAGSQQVTRRRYAGARVDSRLSANYSKPVIVTADGIYPGSLRGSPKISFSVTPFNNFRLNFVREIANRRASGMATSQTYAKLPEKKAQITHQVSSTADRAITQANSAFTQQLQNINSILSDASGFPFQPSLSSRQTDSKAWGFARVSLKDGSGEEKQPRPDLVNAEQPAMTTFLHQDTIVKTITPEIAGKQLKLKDVHDILCSGKFGGVLDFCNKEMDKEAAETSILFDKDQPIELDFNDGYVRLRLNAIYQKHKTVEASGQLLTNPSDPSELKHQTFPYSVDVAYQLTDGGAKRTFLKVTERSQESGKGKKSEQKGDHDNSLVDQLGDFFGRSARNVLATGEKLALQQAFDEAFKKEIPVGPISFPIGLHLQNPQPGAKPTLTKAGSLIPLEAQTKNGWLATSHYFCAEGMSALGVSFQLAAPSEDGNRSLFLTSVSPNSPAQLAGLRSGDWISGFRTMDSKDVQKIGDSYEPFLDFTRKASESDTLKERTVFIEGVNKAGQRFTKQISLCPKGLDHRKAARENINGIRKVASGP